MTSLDGKNDSEIVKMVKQKHEDLRKSLTEKFGSKMLLLLLKTLKMVVKNLLTLYKRLLMLV